MEDKKPRQMNERSLENLKLGAQARSQGKIRRNTTLLPETIAWLEGQGNLSAAIDQLVASARNGQSDNTHSRIEQEAKPSSSNTHNQIRQEDQTELKAKLEAREQEISQLRAQLAETKEELEVARNEIQLPADLEATRDRYLASLRLGKQAPEYKRAKLLLDRFISHCQSARSK